MVEPVNQVGHVHDVERAEVIAEVAGISHFKPHPRNIHIFRTAGHSVAAYVSFDLVGIGELAFMQNEVGSLDESLRKVYTDGIASDSSQLEGGASDRAAQVEGPRLAG